MFVENVQCWFVRDVVDFVFRMSILILMVFDYVSLYNIYIDGYRFLLYIIYIL